MNGAKKVVPGWMRTMSKVGLGMGLFFGVFGVLGHNWPVAGVMLAMVVLQVAMLTTTRSK